MGQKISTLAGTLVILAFAVMVGSYVVKMSNIDESSHKTTLRAELNEQKNEDNTEEVETKSQVANPASVYCKENGGKSEIRTDDDGGQIGYCIFSDGNECEEWQYYRGECQSN